MATPTLAQPGLLPSAQAAAHVPIIGYSSRAPTHVAIVLMLICWVAAAIIGMWGAMRQARRVAGARAQENVTGVDAGPAHGVTGYLDRWAILSLSLVGAGLLLLAIATYWG